MQHIILIKEDMNVINANYFILIYQMKKNVYIMIKYKTKQPTLNYVEMILFSFIHLVLNVMIFYLVILVVYLQVNAFLILIIIK